MALEPGTRLGPYEIVELRGKGGCAAGFTLDVSEPSQIAATVEGVVERFAGLFGD